MNIAIILARGKGRERRNVNMYIVDGKPLVSYTINAALSAKRVDEVFVSTESDEIKELVKRYNCHTIVRSESAKIEKVDIGIVIKDAVYQVKKVVAEAQNFVVLLGNTVMVDSSLIDKSFIKLENDQTLDSVMSVWKANVDHPFLALKQNDEGYLENCDYNGDIILNRIENFPSIYYYDQGIFTFKLRCLEQKIGPKPYWWMGEKCLPLVREWITSRDIENMMEISFAEWWIKNNVINLSREVR